MGGDEDRVREDLDEARVQGDLDVLAGEIAADVVLAVEQADRAVGAHPADQTRCDLGVARLERHADGALGGFASSLGETMGRWAVAQALVLTL